MVTKSDVQVTVSLTELGLDDEELQTQVQNLLPQLRDVDGVEDADLVAVTEVPEGSKALGGFSLGTFKALVKPTLIKPVFDFLGRLSNKTFEIEVEAYGEKFKAKASSKEDLIFILEKTETLLNNAKNRQDSNNG
ncbi:sugar ABC transporter permease [Nostoc sp. MBR 210]|uniref:Sugar ABC transporter permease n=1 Tax=Nostoc spongiaeforme FACHB-130 TaxID=1357510 RepID=A0ABR8FVR4_9NOSO|nr:sugar ABC transporter permease [Nostoc spongiaeforme]MBD2594866.1 sugar ABC transporter permease [Nostoc spongiaeforme FACHB-130]OCQ99025.1 sugar ABC transporter permease [Nostoc sp. MBR 210]